MPYSQPDLALHLLEVIPAVMRTVAAELRRSGHLLNPTHFSVLIILAEGPCILSDLAEQQAVSLPTMSNTISTLVERGWVQRQRDIADRRKVWLALTSAGLAILNEMSQHALRRVNELLIPLSQTERQTLAEGLTVLHRLFGVSTGHTQETKE